MSQVLDKWKADSEEGKEGQGQRPRELATLIRQGIPDVLRGEVWQLLACCAGDNDLVDTYRLLSGKVGYLVNICRFFPRFSSS